MDRNIPVGTYKISAPVSLSARRAWIEIDMSAAWNRFTQVALRKESVDRNTLCLSFLPVVGVALRKESVDRNEGKLDADLWVLVALRKESVDRNIWVNKTQSAPRVALRKESVDRNCCCVPWAGTARMSLSARRAWIEIILSLAVAKYDARSLSARRAWIEISTRSQPSRPRAVALRKESVDRNSCWLLA